MADRINEFADSIKLLMGDRNELFADECALKMFQFQNWLLTRGTDLKETVSTIQYEKSFLRGGRIFTIAVISEVVAAHRSRATRALSASDQFLLVFADQRVRGLVDRYFERPFLLHSVFKISDFPLHKSDYTSALAEIGRLNDLIRVRMQLGPTESLNNALKIYCATRKSISRSTISPIHRSRLQRQPFLFAAAAVAPRYLDLDFEVPKKRVEADPFMTAQALLSQMAEKAKNHAAFRSLCAAAKAVATGLESSILPDLKDVWSALDPDLKSLRLTPIPAEHINKKLPHRPALETKKTSRQLPGQNKST
jgi:hypothetical protein